VAVAQVGNILAMVQVTEANWGVERGALIMLHPVFTVFMYLRHNAVMVTERRGEYIPNTHFLRFKPQVLYIMCKTLM